MTMPENLWRRLDHYYFLTAFLASRDVQALCCRVVAAMIIGLGVISVALIASPLGPHGPTNRAVAVGIAVCCLVMSAVWLRRRWPSATESRMTVVIGTACIAVSCLIQSEPVAGLFGAATFGLVSAYTALFHTPRLLALCWTAAAVTLGVLTVRWAGHDVAFVVSSALLVALVVVFVTFAGRMTIWLLDADIFHPNLDALTGLLNHDGFHEKAATLLTSSSRTDDRFFVVAVVNLDSYSLLRSLAGTIGVDRARIEVARRLRETARSNAVLAHPSDSEFVIADLFTEPDTSPLIERVQGTINAASARLTASVGVVCTPLAPVAKLPAPDVIDELLAVATNAMYDARRAGGNRVTYVHDPALTVLDAPPADEWPDDDTR
ncbi:diguanylate cyclase domain-containing protein [Mycobacterium sp. NPDC050041]|uniref:GGDEF domain-containing protein n=1 Tax=Mycobacterium sp. NPDC050041 TaxID=3364293 RepID=UPI003C2C382B